MRHWEGPVRKDKKRRDKYLQDKRSQRSKEAHRPCKGIRYRYCIPCDKRGFHSEFGARKVISNMLANGTLRDKNAWVFVPYLCPHGWWHVGHDPNILRIMAGMQHKSE